MSEMGHALVVDDQKRLADLFAQWLRPEWETTVAYGGEEALEKIDSSHDIVFLDRLLGMTSGDDVLHEIRDRGFNCQVVMVSNVNPDFDIVDMQFDDYLEKPVKKEPLLRTAEAALFSAEESTLSEWYTLAAKQALLERQKSSRELADSHEYQALQEKLDDLALAVISALQAHVSPDEPITPQEYLSLLQGRDAGEEASIEGAERALNALAELVGGEAVDSGYVFPDGLSPP